MDDRLCLILGNFPLEVFGKWSKTEGSFTVLMERSLIYNIQFCMELFQNIYIFFVLSKALQLAF